MAQPLGKLVSAVAPNQGGPQYDPPYESPIEDAFAFNAVKHLAENISFRKQVEVDTLCGRFRLDFVLSSPKGGIGVECDGEEYHNAGRDEWRDAMILGDGHLRAVCRVRGSDIIYHITDVLYILSLWYPEVFSKRGLINLGSLATRQLADQWHGRADDTNSVFHTYVNPDSRQVEGNVWVERNHTEIPPGEGQFWQALYRFATDMGGGSLDDLIAAHNKR